MFDPSMGGGVWRILAQSKVTNDVLRQIEKAAVKSLQWMVDDKVAQSVTASATRIGVDSVALECVVTRDEAGEPSIVKILWEDYANGT